MRETIRRASRSQGFPIFFGVFLALVVIMIWEAASIHAGYDVWTDTDAGTGEVTRIRIRDGRWQLKIELEGDVELNDDESGIARLGPDACLEIEERRRRQRRRLEATPGAGGEPEIAWFVNRDRVDFDADGENWLAAVLPRIYRSTGLDAEGRVERILARGGPEGVLQEIGEIDSDRIQRLYFEQLTAQADLTPDELGRVLKRLAREIGSDHEMSRALATLSTASLADAPVARGFATAAGTIGSGYTLREVLFPYFQDPDLTPEACEWLLDVAASISDDYQLAALLTELAKEYPQDRPLPSGYAMALKTIGTDFELRRVLSAAIQRRGLAAEELGDLLAGADVASDFDLAEVLVGVAKTWEGNLPREYFRSLSTIGSDYELRRVLQAAVLRPDLAPETLSAVLDAALGIGTDHEMAQLLLTVTELYPIDEGTRPAFERAAATIGSEYERERVETASEG